MRNARFDVFPRRVCVVGIERLLSGPDSGDPWTIIDPPVANSLDDAAIGKLASAGWIAMNWPQIAFAAEAAGHNMAGMDMSSGPTTLNHIDRRRSGRGRRHRQPDRAGRRHAGGARTRGSSISSTMRSAASSPRSCRPSARGWRNSRPRYAKRIGGGDRSPPRATPQQIAWLHEVDKTPFFAAVRRLTVRRPHRHAQVWRQLRQARAGSCSAWRTATSGRRPSVTTTRIMRASSPIPAPRSYIA